MKIVYLGSGEFGIECLNALGKSGQGPALIVTQMPQAAGRGKKMTPTAVAGWAAAHSIPFVETDDVNSTQIVGKITASSPDLIVVIAFGQKIGNELITLPPKGAINVHASLLPKYRGAAPINWAIINGEKETGISIITLAEKMDAGKILAQVKTDIGLDETADQLHDRLSQIAAPLLMETIDRIAENAISYIEQDNSKATRAPKLKKSDGFLNFSENAEILRRKILGLWSWPGAAAIYVSKRTAKRQRVTIAMAEAVEIKKPANLPAGTLDENLNIVCGENALKVVRIKPEGAKLMGFKDFINGRATQPGDMFVSATGGQEDR